VKSKIEIRNSKLPVQRPGCLPKGFDLDSMLTPEQAATWQNLEPEWFRKHMDGMPGVRRLTRETVRIHPRSYLGKT
jgi:hypothetical protein